MESILSFISVFLTVKLIEKFRSLVITGNKFQVAPISIDLQYLMTELDKGQGDLSGNRAEAEAAPAVDPPPQEQEEANQPAEAAADNPDKGDKEENKTPEDAPKPIDKKARGRRLSRMELDAQEDVIYSKHHGVFRVHGKRVLRDKRSLMCCDRSLALRKGFVWFVEWNWFDRFITFVILLNSLLLAFTDYTERVDVNYVSPRNRVFGYIDIVFSVIFLGECVSKLIALGFFWHKNSYLRDAWNWLDFFIVIVSVIGWLPFFDAGALKALRTFRILRPLRSINSLPEMRNLIGTLMASIPGLMNVLFFLMFIFGIFAIFGVNQFNGDLYNRCRTSPEPFGTEAAGDISWPMVDFEGWLCVDDASCESQVESGELAKCGNLGKEYRISPTVYDSVIDQESIQYGIVGFDEMGQGMRTIFQVLTLEGWSDLTYNYSDANDPTIAVIFFVGIVVMGAMFAMNLVLGQVMESFYETKESQMEEKMEKAKAEKREREHQEAEDRRLQQEEEEEARAEAERLGVPYEAPNKSEEHDANNPDVTPEQIDPTPKEFEEKDAKDVDIEYDSTGSMWFGDSEEDFEVAARRRARAGGCLRCMYLFVTSVTFNFTVFLLILANTLTLALYRYDQSDEKTYWLGWCNEFFTWAFFGEMVAKIIGLGPRNYVGDVWNKFDAVVVTISLIDWTIAVTVPPEDIGSAGEALNAFRAMRLLRVIKLARLWGALAKILQQTLASLQSLTYYAALLFLFMFIFALLGMELFAMNCKYDTDDELIKGSEAIQAAFENGDVLLSPRENFDTVEQALATIFIVILGEDWNWVEYAFVRAVGYESTAMYYLVMTYFMLLMILGNIMLFSLFTAILLENFEGDMSEQIQAAKEESLANSKSELKRSVTQKLMDKDTWKNFAEGFHNAFSARHERRPRPTGDIDEAEANAEAFAQADVEDNPPSPGVVREEGEPSEEKIDDYDNPFATTEERRIRDEIRAEKMNRKGRRSVLEMQERRSILMHYGATDTGSDKPPEEEVEPVKQMHGRSLWCFSKTNPLRHMCWVIATNKWFDNIILFLIVVSTLTLAVETPFDDPQGQKVEILGYIDYFMTGAFTLECLLKILAFGFVATQTAYIRDPWNILDFVIVLSAVAGFVLPPDVNISAVKSLRILRILRPLKIIAKNPSLKIALVSLVNSIPKIGNLQVIVFFFMFLLAILQTTLLSGKFYRCHTDHLEHLSYRQQAGLIVDKWDCINYGGEWLNPYLHFDDTLWSLLTLFTIQTTEGWIGVMWDATNAVGVDLQPQENFAPYMVIVFIILIVIISMLFLNLFVGVVIETFNAEKELLSYNQLLKSSQKSWIQVQIMTYSVRPALRNVHTGSWLRDRCIDLVTHKAFDGFIMGCIIGNTIVLAIKWYIMPLWVVSVIEVVNYIFMVIFTLEAVFKVTAMRGNYFKDSWNVFDFTVVVLTALILGLKAIGIGENLGVTSTILRSLRIGRIFRLVKRAEKLQIIFQALIDAVPSMGSLGLLLFLLIFMYSIIGISQFALIKIDGGLYDIPGYYMGQDAMHKHANFQSFGAAFLTLFRCATGEAWNSIMFDSARERSILFQCREGEDYYSWQDAGGEGGAGMYDAFACGSPAVAFGYHMSFQIIVSQVFLNIFIAIILDSFAGQAGAFALPVNQNSIDDFVLLWAQYDPHATGYLPAKDLEQFIIDLAESDGASGLLLDAKDIIPYFGEQEDPLDDQTKVAGRTWFTMKKVVMKGGYHNEPWHLKLTEAQKEKLEELRQAQENQGDMNELDTRHLYEVLDLNAEYRRRYLAQLEIPMYGTFEKVMFYDVLQQLTLQVTMEHFNRDKIEEVKLMLKGIAKFAAALSFPKVHCDTIGAISAFGFQDQYNVDFHDMSTGSPLQDLKVDLLKELKKKVKAVTGGRKDIQKVDKICHVVPGAKGLYTTRHYIYGSYIKECIKEWNREGVLPKQKQPGPPKAKYVQPDEDRDGRLGNIPEQEADQEHTNKLASQRQSQTDMDQINVAINEDQQSLEMVDTAFHNDKQHLK